MFVDASLTIMCDKKCVMGNKLLKKFYHKFKNTDFDLVIKHMTKGPFPFVVDAYFIIRNLIDNKKIGN